MSDTDRFCDMNFDMKNCTLCPRRCGADRTVSVGVCGIGDRIRVARAALHMWEEPCISGTRGSGAVFFSGCAMKCSFCQNLPISGGCYGADITESRFEEILFELKDAGAHNINLVTASHQLPLIIGTLEKVKKSLGIPIVYNCGGYESPEQLAMLCGIVDVYLPDFKFFGADIAEKYASAPDYREVAERAVAEMVRQTGKCVIENGLLVKGTMVRHLILPGHRDDSKKIVDRLAELFPNREIMLSLMSQYTPVKGGGGPSRRLTTFEYRSVAELVEKYGFDGYFQERSSAKEEYTPPFDLSGVVSDKKE